MIVTEVGVDPKVSALVYVAARAPDAGEDYTALAKNYPTPPASAGIVFNDEWGQLSEEAFLRDFAGDLPPEEARVLYAVQQPFKKSLTTEKTTNAAWRTKPTFSCRLHPRPNDQSRPGAVHGEANGREDDRNRSEPPRADLTTRCDHEFDPGGTRRLRQVGRVAGDHAAEISGRECCRARGDAEQGRSRPVDALRLSACKIRRGDLRLMRAQRLLPSKARSSHCLRSVRVKRVTSPRPNGFTETVRESFDRKLNSPQFVRKPEKSGIGPCPRPSGRVALPTADET